MKKKILLLIVAILSAVMLFGCGKGLSLGEYGDKYKNDNTLKLDDGVKLDGVLDEDFWATTGTRIDIAGVTTDSYTKEPVDIARYGERSASVYVYIGENAIYFAFDVKDKNLYYNSTRPQGQNSTVELYFSDISIGKFGENCWSYRVTPTGKDGDEGVVANLWRSHRYLSKEKKWVETWRTTEVYGVAKAGAKVNGKVMTSEDDTAYTTEGNEGYVVEMALSKSLLTKYDDALQFTAAFAQAREFENRNRIGNSFIAGTSYMVPAKWIIATNERSYSVAERNAYLDSRITVDEGVTIDGSFDDGVWDGTVGRTITTPYSRDGVSDEKLAYTMRTATTDSGVYVGIESNDRLVYFHEGIREQYSTGAEIGIAANSTTMINDDYVLQYRINANGDDYRLSGKVSDGTTAFSYIAGVYFPVKSATKVLGAEINSGESDGWTAEIYIPWTSFYGGVSVFDTIALNVGCYRASADGVTKAFVTPMDVMVYSYGGPNMNPQERWFVFEDGKPVYDYLSVPSVTMDVNDLDGGIYSTTLEVKYVDDVIYDKRFTDSFPATSGGALEFDVPGVMSKDNGDGTYQIRMTTQTAAAFANGKTAYFTLGSEKVPFRVSVDTELAIDGIVNEAAYNAVNPIRYNSGASSSEVKLFLRDNALYLSAVINDSSFTAKKNDLSLGLELNLSASNALSYEDSYRVCLYSDESEARVYRYNELSLNKANPWRGNYAQSNGIRYAFVDNNDGSYNIEARIPYDEIGFSEKPEKIYATPYTRYVKSAADNTVESEFAGMTSAAASNDLDAYQTFDDKGFAPTKLIATNVNGDRVNLVSVVRPKSSVETLDGEFGISLYANGIMPVEGAQFGEYTQYFSELGGGKYSFSIPKSKLSEFTVIPVTTEDSRVNSYVTVRAIVADKLVISADGYNVFRTKKKGDYYEFKSLITADDDGLVPLVGVTFDQDCEATDYGNGWYLLKVPASKFENSTVLSVVATFEGEKRTARGFTLFYDSWTEEELGKVKSYLDFDGDTVDSKGNAVTENGTMQFVDRVDGNDAISLKNTDRTVNVAQSLGTDDFSISFDFVINAADSANTSARYELFDSGLGENGNNDKADDTVQISVRSDWGSLGLRIQMGYYALEPEYDSYAFKNLDGIMKLDEWNTLTVIVDRNAEGSTAEFEKVTVTLYVNGQLIKTNVLNRIVPGTVFGGDELRLGGGPYGIHKKSLMMDNFLLYDGLLSEKQVADIASSTLDM